MVCTAWGWPSRAIGFSEKADWLGAGWAHCYLGWCTLHRKKAGWMD